MMGVPVIDYLVSDDYYYWFHDTIKQPLLTYGITTIDGTAQTPVLRYQPISGTTGISQIAAPSEITITPNPSSGKFLLSNISSTNALLEVVNTLGQKVNFQQTNKEQSVEVDLSNLPKGVYFIKVTDGRTSSTHKVIVEF